MRSGIYEIVSTISGRRYIGSAADFRLRWKAHRFHLDRGTHHSRRLQGAWKRDGADSFVFRILIVCAREHLLMFEQLALDAYEPEYNTLRIAGSALGHRHSEETRAKISASRIGNKHTLGHRHTPETLAKMAAAKIGNTHTKGKARRRDAVEKTAAAHRGMRRSAETRARISAAMTGKKQAPRSEEWRRNLSLAQKGKPKSPAAIEKMRLTKTGSRLTPEHRAAIGAASKAAWARRKAAIEDPAV